MTRPILTPPFVLLDDARAPTTDGRAAASARLYRAPVQIVTTRRTAEVGAALDALRTATAGGLHAAGYLAYEAGAGIEPRLGGAGDGEPLLWFGLFRDYAEIASGDVPELLPDAAGGWLGAPVSTIDRASYVAALARVQAAIAAGDLYQANLTFAAEVSTAGHPLALYAGLRARSAAGHGAVVATGSRWLLSLSPELFFALDGDRVVTRPIKGTAPAGSDPALLSGDAKQRAENLMIVDLLRNDLARVAVAGSVAVPDRFAVEAYPTLRQMSSTVTATLAPGRDAVDVLAALFPCGSITGAPKIAAAQALAAIEGRARGAYTGSIGRLDAGGEAASFNVAIRTLTMTGEGPASMGLGSGIVADSQAHEEWNECLAKGRFVPSTRVFDLIETMAFDPLGGLLRLDAHLARLAASAAALGFAFDRHATRNELQAGTFRLRDRARVRLLLARGGAMAVAAGPMPAILAEPVEVAIVPLPVDPDDIRLRHKTSDRGFYDAARGAHFEVIFVNREGRLTEGSFTNVFVERDGRLLTPPLARGLLGGILRGALIAEGRAIEAELTPRDLARGCYIGNALRGLLPARVLAV